MNDPATEDQDFELWRDIHKTKYLLTRTRKKELNEYGVSIFASGGDVVPLFRKPRS